MLVPGAGAGAVCELAVHAGAVSWLRAWWRQVAGAGRWVPVLVLTVHVVETGCWCWCWVLGAGAGAVSWCRVLVLVLGPVLVLLCTWWKQVAGAGCRVPLVVPGAGAVSWLCTWWRQVAGAGAGCRAPVRVL